METRENRRKFGIITKVVIIGSILGVISLTGIPFLNNDTTVYHDTDVEKALGYVGQPNTEVDWTEAQFQDAMHKMTHQKVIAKAKIGAAEVNDKNIEAMIEIAEHSSYEHREYYLEVLLQWIYGDFSNVDKVHNEIRKLQGKPEQDSRAYREASAREEQKFIEIVFKD